MLQHKDKQKDWLKQRHILPVNANGERYPAEHSTHYDETMQTKMGKLKAAMPQHLLYCPES